MGGVGAPLITSVSLELGVPLDGAQWTLTITLFAGAIFAPVLGRLGAGPRRRTSLIVALALVAFGGLLTTIPLPFWALLAGRALQGLGVAAVAPLMSVARDHLPAERARSTIATIAVAGTVGLGVSYPLMGLVNQLVGLRVAYGAGFLLSVTAVLIAWRAIPNDIPGPAPRIDIPGAVLLGLGMFGVLLVVAQPSVWDLVWVGSSILALALGVLGAWTWLELRTPSPLVDLRLLAAGGVLRANAAMFAAGIGVYLLFSLLTRFVQAPAEAGYGFGFSGVLAGAALIPFSVFGFVAGRLTPWLTARMSTRWVFAIYAGFVMIAAGLFAIAPDSIAAMLTSITVLGFGVGGLTAVMPTLVLNGVPQTETSSVLSINQIVRMIGFSIGSALAGLLLATATPSGALFPDKHGYAAAAIYVVPLLGLAAVIILLSPRATALARNVNRSRGRDIRQSH